MALTATQQSKLKAAGYKAAAIKAFGTAGLSADQVKKLIAKKAGAAAPAKKAAAAKRLVKPAAKRPAAAPAGPRLKARVEVTAPAASEAPTGPNNGPRGSLGWGLAHFSELSLAQKDTVLDAVRPFIVAIARADGATVESGAEISIHGKAFRDGMDTLIRERNGAGLNAWADENFYSVRAQSDRGVWEAAVHPQDFNFPLPRISAAPAHVPAPGNTNFADVGTLGQQALYARRPADPWMSQIDAFDRYQGADLRSVATVDKITTAVESHFGVHIDWPTGATGGVRGRVVEQTKGKRPGADLQIHSQHRVVVVKADRSGPLSNGDDVSILSTTTGKDLAKALVDICKRATGQN